MSDFTPMRKSREVYIPGPDSDEGRRRKWFEENEEKIRAFEARLLEGAALIEEGMRIVAALEARAEKAEADLAAEKVRVDRFAGREAYLQDQIEVNARASKEWNEKWQEAEARAGKAEARVKELEAAIRAGYERESNIRAEADTAKDSLWKAEADLAAAREIIADTLTDSMDADAEYWAALRERANIFLKRATERESGAKQECGA